MSIHLVALALTASRMLALAEVPWQHDMHHGNLSLVFSNGKDSKGQAMPVDGSSGAAYADVARTGVRRSEEGLWLSL